MSGVIARRYAGALFKIAQQSGNPERVVGQLAEVAGLYEDSRSPLKSLVANPRVGREEKIGAIRQVAQALEAPPFLQKFLLLLLRKRRFGYIAEIGRSFAEMAADAQGRETVAVTSARPIPAPVAAGMRQRLAAALGRSAEKLDLDIQVDPGLIGGLRVRIGSRVYEGDLRSRLTRLGALFNRDA